MAIKNYKVGEPIKVLYLAPNRQSGLTDVKCNVYDATDTLDAAQSGYMEEIGSSGRYKHYFTPDTEGDWSVEIIVESLGGGTVIKHYSVGHYNIQEIGANLQSVEYKIDSIRDNIISPPMIG
ncbi:MAG: hypothetical protein ACTSUO_08490 [Candidatus Thorarchaeota archaeon]